MAEQRIRSLLRHLSGSSTAAQQQAATALANLVAAGDAQAEHAQALAAAGGVPLVLQLAWGSSAPAVQKAMAVLLASLCCMADSGDQGVHSSLLAAVEAAGGIPAVVRSLSSQEMSVQLASAWMLVVLCKLGTEHCEQMAAAGAIPVLLRLLRSCTGTGSPAATDVVAAHLAAVAAMVLGVLADGSFKRAEAIAAGGGVQLLCRCLASCSEDNEAENQAASALAQMALALPSAAALACTIPALVPLLARRNARTQMAAAIALRFIACAGSTAAADIAAAGGVPALVQLLGGGSTSEGALESAAAALADAVFDSAGAKLAAVEAGAAPALVRLLGHASAAVQQAAAAAINRLGHHAAADVVTALLAAGAVLPLSRLLLDSPDPGVQYAAVSGLQNMTAHPLCRQATDAAVAIPPLVAALGSPHQDVQEAAAEALHNLACEDALLPAITAAGGIGALERLCGSSSSISTARAREVATGVLDMVRSSVAAQPAAGSAPAAAPGTSQQAASAAGAPPAPPALQPARPPAPRVCAAPGCSATRGLKRCGGCGSVRYCSVACSRAHWRAHKAECRRLQAERAAAAAEAGAAAAGGNA